MTSILPSPSTSVPVQVASTVPTVVVSDPPPALAQLPNGTLLTAEIVDLLNRTTAEVETDVGNFQIRSNVALLEGAQLDLQLLKNGPQPQLVVRAVNGQPVPGAPVHAPGDDLGASSPQGDLRSSLGVNRTANQPSASLPVGAVDHPNQPPPLPLMSPGRVVRATVALPAPMSQAPANPQTPDGTVAPAALQGEAPQNGASESNQPLFLGRTPPGSRIDLRLLSITQPGETAKALPDAATGQPALRGTVTAFSPNGRPIVTTPEGVVSLETSTPLKLGTELVFGRADAAPSQSAPVAPNSLPELILQNRAWPKFEQAIAHLIPPAIEGQTAAPASPVPQANTQLANNILGFVTALKSGDIGAWLGDTSQSLPGHSDLARALQDDFAQLSQTYTAARTPDDWRTAIIPFYFGNNLEPVEMHLRGGSPKSQAPDQDEGSRFIIDLRLTRLGRIQLDGLVKAKRKNFELIVRTGASLPQRMRRDISQIFFKFGEVTGLRGSIAFQASARFIDVPLPRIIDRAQNGLFI